MAVTHEPFENIGMAEYRDWLASTGQVTLPDNLMSLQWSAPVSIKYEIDLHPLYILLSLWLFIYLFHKSHLDLPGLLLPGP